MSWRKLTAHRYPLRAGGNGAVIFLLFIDRVFQTWRTEVSHGRYGDRREMCVEAFLLG